jgi:hypothetical protein
MDTDKGIYLFFPAGTTLGGFPPSTSSIGPRSSDRRPTFGRSRSASGKSFIRSHLTSPPSPCATRCPCAGAPLRPRLPLPSLPRGGRFRQGHATQADLLRFQDARFRVCWPGLVTRFYLAPANAHELSVVPEPLDATCCGVAVSGTAVTGLRKRRKSWRRRV